MIFIIAFTCGMVMISHAIVICVMGRHIPKILEQNKKKSKQNNKFKQIYENLDESIILINQFSYKLEFLNKFFYQQFKHVLKTNKSGKVSVKQYRHNYFADIKVFELFKSEKNEQFSIKDILRINKARLKQMIFIYSP